MARTGISYSHVAQAAASLLDEGKNPTVDNVRDALGGTGSKSTIAPFLKRWKAEHQDALAGAAPGLPAVLLQAVKGLHEQMQAEFAQQLEQARQECAAALDAAGAREQQWRAAHDAALAEKAALAGELARANEALAQLQAAQQAQSVTLATVQAQNAGLQQRLADRAQEVASLNHQLSQTRAQFEHYQEAAAAQRAEERQAAEQRMMRIQQELAVANRQIAAQQSTLGQQDARLSHLAADNASLRQTLQLGEEGRNTMRSERDRLAERLEESTLARENLAGQISAAQQQLMDTKMSLAAQERETGLLAERARHAEARAEQIAAEKFAWLQERAALQQQLAQSAANKQ